MTINYPKICLNLLENLPDRTRDVLDRRFGLTNENASAETLEAIGKKYGLTRERVRQIEADGMKRLKDPKIIKIAAPAFDLFEAQLKSQGGAKREDLLLSEISEEKFRHYVYFLLTLGDLFYRCGETPDYYSFWTIKQDIYKLICSITDKIVSDFKKELKPQPKDKVLETKTKELKSILGTQISPQVLWAAIEIAKGIEENPFGEVGLVDWPEVNPRGIKDKAYIVLKKEGKPLHFGDITKKINELKFNKGKALSQTVHNELIKDQRFILVGRGIYALQEWGYKAGWVRDIIIEILNKEKNPLTKDEIVEKVLKQRLVKPNTILLNLSNKDYFVKTEDGKFLIHK